MHVPPTSKVKLLDTECFRLDWDTHYLDHVPWILDSYWLPNYLCYDLCHRSLWWLPDLRRFLQSILSDSILMHSLRNDFRVGVRGQIMYTVLNGTYQLQQLQFRRPYRVQALAGCLSESGSKRSFVIRFEVGILKVVAFVLSLSFL